MMEDIEVSRLNKCEAVIERGMKTFVDVGNALLEIRESRLYRAQFGTFEDYCRERWGMSKPYAVQMIQASNAVGNLVAIATVLPTNEAQARPLTRLEPAEQREAWARAVETAPNGRVTAAHVQSVVDEMLAPEPAPVVFMPDPATRPHVANNSGNNEWYTPAEFIDAAYNVMGGIDLDPASSEIANKTVGALEYYTAENNGLTYEWGGRVWMNPPYSGDLIGKFSEKITRHYAAGDISEAIILVNNATETTWFQNMLTQAAAVCFPKSRIKFIDMGGNPSGAPLQGQAILYLGVSAHKFVSEFSKFGAVLHV